MKRKLIFISFFCLFFGEVMAQEKDPVLDNIDWAEDTTQVTSINRIIQIQQDVSSRNNQESHFSKVWGYRTFVNIAYNNAKLNPQTDIPMGVGDQSVPQFKSDWGVSIKWGSNYRLHKKPIANIVAINLDYTWLDFNVNHYKPYGDGKYDSNNKTHEYTKDDETDFYYYLPWALKKYEFNYGMSIGPSVTVAPFTMLDNRSLHYVKLNLYYHIGYNASLLLMKNEKGNDLNTQTTRPTEVNPTDENSKAAYEQKLSAYENHENTKSSQLSVEYGFMNSFGFNVSWKFIGIGYEWRSSSMKLQALNTSQFSAEKYKFKSSVNRIYLQFRF